jgi:hypothetical protein
MFGPKRSWLALLCSLAVYLIPVVGPHAAFTVGEIIAQQFRDFKSPGWAFSALGIAVALQAAAFALFYWFWKRRGALPLAALIVCGIAAVIAVQYIYMIALPTMFMIEPEKATETGDWPEVCGLADASVMTYRTSTKLLKDGWSEAWLMDSHENNSILRMPGCQRVPAPLPKPTLQPGGRADFLIGIVQVAPGGLALVQRQIPGNSKVTWMLLDVGAGKLNPLPAPETTKYVTPYLSDDGLQTAWILPVPGSQPPILEQIHILPTAGTNPERILDLSPFGPNTYETVSLDSKSGEALLWVSQPLPGRLLAARLDGRELPAPTLPASVRPQSHTMVLTDHGVIAWDASKDDNYIIAWSLEAGSGSRTIPKGSSITAAAVDPSGRFIAVSTTTTLNIGKIRDSVLVLRARDGQEVFRRFLPMYSRTNVVFLGRDYLAYSDSSRVRVVRVPAE